MYKCGTKFGVRYGCGAYYVNVYVQYECESWQKIGIFVVQSFKIGVTFVRFSDLESVPQLLKSCGLEIKSRVDMVGTNHNKVLTQ